jgi:hypothetical protein
MKIKNLLILYSIVVCCIFNSCSKDDSSSIHEVEVRVSSNTPDALVNVLIRPGNGEIQMKDKWKFIQFIDTDEFDSIDVGANCPDKDVLITVEIYVDGKIKKMGAWNGAYHVGYRF